MRKLILLAVTLGSPFLAAAGARHALGPSDVKAHLAGAEDAIEQCYLGAVGDRAGAGRLEIKLTIHRKGIVDAIDVTSPSVSAKTAKQIDTCVRAALDGISFPARRVGTTAVVPYFWQKTAAPDSGPQLSCWNPKGCPSGSDVKPTKTEPKPAVIVRQARRAKSSS